jgi:hypothetical protein
MNISNTDYFPSTYQQSRPKFLSWLPLIQKYWPNACLGSCPVPDQDSLTIDWIQADSLGQKEQVILLNGGLHGVEGYVGSAMQTLFVEEFLTRLDPQTTGFVLVHAINPWGMFNKRRVNPNNVDLNRNFMVDKEIFQSEFNHDYQDLNPTLNPSTSLAGLFLETSRLLLNVGRSITKSGITSLRNAVLFGQRSYPDGLYFCGEDYQDETLFMIDLVKGLFEAYSSIIQIDLHTGYGPRYQMSLVYSPSEPRTSQELEKEFNYPRALKADPEQFYKMQGDMIDWAYQLQREQYQDKSYFGTAFEFGTYGSGIRAEIKSLRTMIFENQIYNHGSSSTKVEKAVRNRFIELFYPEDNNWKKNALKDCRQAYEGIFSAYGLI